MFYYDRSVFKPCIQHAHNVVDWKQDRKQNIVLMNVRKNLSNRRLQL